MIISIGKIRLKDAAFRFRFLRMSKRIEQEAKSQKGNIAVQLEGQGELDFWTFTVWDSNESMHHFSTTGSHHEAVKRAPEIAREIALYNFESENIPSFQAAKEKLEVNLEDVRILRFSAEKS